MKKLISAILALSLAASFGTAAFAAVNDGTAGTDIDVNAKYVDGMAAPTVYSVDVAWGAMEFTYTVSGTKTWDAKNHGYDITSDSTWSADGNEITVTNHSNTAVKAEFGFTAIPEYDSVNGAFSKTELTLPTAEGKATNAAELTGRTEFMLSGELDRNVTAMTRVGTVTVTVREG